MVVAVVHILVGDFACIPDSLSSYSFPLFHDAGCDRCFQVFLDSTACEAWP